MAQEDQNGFRPSRHGIEVNDGSIPYRVRQTEKDICDLEKFSDELRLDRTTLEVKLAQISTVLDRHERDIALMKTATSDLGTLLNKRIDELREALTAKIEDVKATTSKWSIAILMGIVIGVAVGLLSRFV